MWRAEPGSVRHTTKHQSDWWASEVQTFWPVTTHSSPSSSARVATLARSLPALGSEYPWHHSSVPSTIRGRKRSCWASVPYWISVGPSSPSPRMLTRPGALAFTYSSLKITWWAMEAPRPPNSTGQPRHGPAAGGQHLLPLEADLEPERLVARAAASAQGGELADHVVGQPGLDLVAEGLVLGSVSKVHASRVLCGGGAGEVPCPEAATVVLTGRGRAESDATLANRNSGPARLNRSGGSAGPGGPRGREGRLARHAVRREIGGLRTGPADAGRTVATCRASVISRIRTVTSPEAHEWHRPIRTV